jgi:DtxR family Mn-dependent transcriptional regulator
MVFAATVTGSLEDYLEAIYHIIAEKHAVRPKDIARRLKVSNSSVTGALRALAQKKLINYAPYDVISLTPDGETVAKDVIRRHELLRDFFVHVLGVEEGKAETAACQMEHFVPRVIVERLIQFVEFIDVCPRAGASWLAGFARRCEQKGPGEDCEKCISGVLEELRRRKGEGGEKAMKTLRLKDLRPGQKGKVLKVTGRSETRKRIVEMGVTAGAVVEVERVAPLGDPIEVKVKGYHLSLRKDEAAGIEIEPLEGGN